MPVDPEQRPFIDLVQIRCPATPADPDGSFGSGWLVRPGIVLTALHCVAIEKQGWIDRELIEVYLWRDLRANVAIRYTATVEWPPSNRSNPADIAVLKIQKSDAPEPFLVATFCELPGGEFRGESVGFPRAAASSDLTGGRVEHREYGNSFLSSVARPTLRFRSTGETEQAGKDAWSGLSGGPLRCEGAIVGVMREVPENWDGRSVLEAEPLPALLRNPGGSRALRRWLDLRGPLPPAPQPTAAVPAQPAGPAFKADPAFIRLLDYLYTLDRVDEIDVAMPQIGQHVGNRPVKMLAAGHPEDRCNDFYSRLWHEILNATPLAGEIDGAGTIPALQPGPPPRQLPGRTRSAAWTPTSRPWRAAASPTWCARPGTARALPSSVRRWKADRGAAVPGAFFAPTADAVRPFAAGGMAPRLARHRPSATTKPVRRLRFTLLSFRHAVSGAAPATRCRTEASHGSAAGTQQGAYPHLA